MKAQLNKIIALALVLLLLPIGVLARTYNIVEGPFLENDAITGYTQSYKDVTLYYGEKQTLRNSPDRSIQIGYDRSDANGFFEIPFDYVVGDYDTSDELNFEYNGRRITATTSSPSMFYEIYNRYNNDRLASGYSDKDGRINTDIGEVVRRPSDYTVIEYKKTLDISDLDNYYLVVSDRYGTSSKHYLKGMNVSSTLPNFSDDPVKPTINTVRAKDTSIRGYGTNAEAIVVIYDNSKIVLGKGTANLNGVFKIDLNRELISNERVQIDIVTSSGKIASTYVTVDYGINQYNYQNEFKIGSKTYTQTVNGRTTAKQMDVAPFITDGRTMLPLRYVGESLGYDVSYERLTHHAVLTNADTVVHVDLNSNKYTIDGREFQFKVKPELVSDRTMLPVAEIGMALNLTHGNVGEGRNIEWDGVNRTVLIQVDK